MILAHFLTPVNEANSYLACCEESREALLVDVPAWEPRMAAYAELLGVRIRAIFITHAHFDHVDGLPEALRSLDAEIYAGCAKVAGCRATVLRHGDTLRVGPMEARVLATPGHTPESLCLALPGMVFTGDALFAGSVGGTGSPEAHQQEIAGIRAHVFSLPEDWLVHPGHGPSSTIGIERRHNPFFAAPSGAADLVENS